MRFSKRAAATLICAALILGTSAASFAVEMTLAGVKLGSSASMVLKRYGNPTRITIGTVAVGTVNTPSANGMSPAPTPAGAPAPVPPPMYGGTSYPGFGGEPGALPGLPGMGMPGMPNPTMPGMPGMPGAPQQAATITEEQLTWTYDLVDGTTVEFLVSETGRIIQITVGGEKPWGLSRTAKGIKLGNNYKEVVFKYGYPEGHSYAGRFLRVSYADKQRCVFTFLGKKLVGITIAFKPE